MKYLVILLAVLFIGGCGKDRPNVCERPPTITVKYTNNDSTCVFVAGRWTKDMYECPNFSPNKLLLAGSEACAVYLEKPCDATEWSIHVDTNFTNVMGTCSK